MTFELVTNPNDVLDDRLVDKKRGITFRKKNGYQEGFTCELSVNGDVFYVFVNESFEQGKSIWSIKNISFPEGFSEDRKKIDVLANEGLEAYRAIIYSRVSNTISVRKTQEFK